jgi:hypothetical protein
MSACTQTLAYTYTYFLSLSPSLPLSRARACALSLSLAHSLAISLARYLTLSHSGQGHLLEGLNKEQTASLVAQVWCLLLLLEAGREAYADPGCMRSTSCTV